MNECCHAQLFVRSVRIWLGKQTDTDHFTCETCHQSYRRDQYRIWLPLSAVEDLQDMVKNDPRGHLTEDE